MNWLEIAKNLPQGQTVRHDCPNCGEDTQTNAAIVNNNHKYYSIHCYACDFNDYESKGIVSLEERKRVNDINKQLLEVSHKIELPSDITYNHKEFSQPAILWLLKGGLTTSVWKQHRIGYSKRLERVILPVYNTENVLVWYQCRAVLRGQSPKYIQPSGDRSSILYLAGNKNTTDRVIVVEDIMSAIRVGGAVENINVAVISTLGTKVTVGQATYLGKFEKCTTWYDGDKAGKRGAYTIGKTIGLLTECNNIQTDKDPKCYSNKQIRDIIMINTRTIT